MNIPEKIILNNPLNWILSWNEWITQFLNRYLPFLMISPLFCLFWTLFSQFLGTFPIWPVLIIPWLLNWIMFWIESPQFILNWIIFWIESWEKRYGIEYWMNNFFWQNSNIELNQIGYQPPLGHNHQPTGHQMSQEGLYVPKNACFPKLGYFGPKVIFLFFFLR